MSTHRVLSQEEIDSVFRNNRQQQSDRELATKTQPYDFRRPDRIPKDQINALYVLHENLARSLASSLSAYIRAYIMVNLVSVEQLSFREFAECLPTPSYMVALEMKPYEGSAILELNPAIVFPMLELLLGGTGQKLSKIVREVTEIEQSIIDGLLRIILQNLKAAWQSVTNLDFRVSAHETDPALLQILAPNEALVAISMEIRVGENSGMMNIGIPSIIIKMLRQKFDQQWSVRKADMTAGEQSRIMRLIQPASIRMDARLQGPTLSVEDMMRLEVGDVLGFDYAAGRSVDMLVNGKLKYRGQIVTSNRNKAFEIEQEYSALD
ncbi:MAG TPA: flagellar motor switch protein FliM [Bryobacteraceae bacterium]|nr:flagellar motor switch protein FliM [Bryobacteraceae bacterium]